jgi:hypothetical protein
MTSGQFLMMLRPRLARALANDFANDIAVTEEQARRDRCLERGEIPALPRLSGCGRAAALGRRDLNCARSPSRSHPCCPAFLALTLADQLHGSTLSRLTGKPVPSFNVSDRIWLPRRTPPKFRHN